MGIGIGKVYARLIRRGARKLKDVPDKYKQDVIDAYMELFGEVLTDDTQPVIED